MAAREAVEYLFQAVKAQPPDYESGGQEFESLRARQHLAPIHPSRFAGRFAKSVSKTFSNLAIALSASWLVRARYLSRISCARRKLWPVIVTISPMLHPARNSIVTVVPRMSWKCRSVMPAALQVSSHCS